MDDEFVKMLIANLPQFIGLVYLAFAMTKRAEKCEERYNEIVGRLQDELFNDDK